MKIRRLVWTALTILLVGCGVQHNKVVSSSHPQIPWEAIRAYNVNTVQVKNQIRQKTFDSKNQNDERVVQQVVLWLNQSKGQGEETNLTIPKAGVTTLSLTLKDGLAYEMQPAFSCSTTGNTTTCTPENGIVDFRVDGVHGVARLQSPALYQWLHDNQWAK